jgi:hypothetical protein
VLDRCEGELSFPVDAMGIGRLLDSRQPANTHGIYHCEPLKVLLLDYSNPKNVFVNCHNPWGRLSHP